MKALVAAAGLLAVCASMAAAQPGQDSSRALHFAFNDDGTVTLRARNVTAREILMEWARQCACVVVNADRLVGAPVAVPIVFENAPQAAVIRSLLRQAAGYTLTPKRAGTVSPSDYETIHILPLGSSTASFTAIPARPTFQIPTAGSPDDEIPPVIPISAQEGINSAGAAGPAPAGGQATPAPAGGASSGLPNVNVPGVRVVPIVPVSPAPQPGVTPPPPDSATPAGTP